MQNKGPESVCAQKIKNTGFEPCRSTSGQLIRVKTQKSYFRALLTIYKYSAEKYLMILFFHLLLNLQHNSNS